MRAKALGLAAAFGLTLVSISAQAGPVAPPVERTAGAAVTLVAGGCGPGYVPRTYYDRFGRPFTECVPGGAYRRCPPGMYWRTWRDPYGRIVGRCVP